MAPDAPYPVRWRYIWPRAILWSGLQLWQKNILPELFGKPLWKKWDMGMGRYPISGFMEMTGVR